MYLDVWSTVNLALYRPAYQSSTLHYMYQFSTVASLAVDGNTDQTFDHRSCTHTNDGDLNPWFAVDLGSEMRVHHVVLYNRLDYGGKSITTLFQTQTFLKEIRHQSYFYRSRNSMLLLGRGLSWCKRRPETITRHSKCEVTKNCAQYVHLEVFS